MQFVTLQAEQSLTDLARRVFNITGKDPDEVVRKAEKALVDANPHLRDFNNVQGTLVMVPDLAGLIQRETRCRTPMSVELAAQLRSALDSAYAALENSAKAQTEQANETLALSKDEDLKEIVDPVPELEERIRNLVEEARINLKEIEITKEARIEEVTQLKKELEAFMK